MCPYFVNRATQTRQVLAPLLALLLTCCVIPIHNSFAQQKASTKQNKGHTFDHTFETEIMPLFSRFGCNAAECHGSATGQGDFKLSLFGGDPDRDYNAIVEQLDGRRVNLVTPKKSLLVAKPTEVLAHGGEELFEEDSKPARRLIKWIQDGAQRGSSSPITGIQLSKQKVIISDNDRFELKVHALAQGRQHDVTDDSNFSSTNPTAMSVTKNGLVQVHRPGKYFVVVKYLQFAETVTVIKPFQNRGTPTRLFSGQDNANAVDSAIERSLTELNVNWPSPVSDSVFVRRLYLDVTGKLPTKLQTLSYVKDKDPSKKESLVDRLLASPEFLDNWTFWVRKIIHFRTPGNDSNAAKKLNDWIRNQLKEDASWHKLSHEFVTAIGNTEIKPQANFHRFFTDARAESEVVANAFLGIRIGCANCHNHPLDRWTQEDYHGLAAIFATIKRGKVVTTLPNGNVIQPKTAKPAIARIPGAFDLESSKGAREVLSKWLSGNDQFKYAVVNRVWKHFMGKGLVEPVDDFRASNPPVDPQLLESLAVLFEDNGFRFKPLIKLILMSEIYSTRSMEKDYESAWAGYVSKRIEPEVFYDISKSLLLSDSSESAVNSLDPQKLDRSLGLLKGCTPRECAISQSASEFGLREKLHLLNGDFLNRWIHNPKNRFRRKLSASQPIDILDEFYWAAFSRSMKSSERQFWKSASDGLDDEKTKIQFLEDAIWTLLNSSEFYTIR